jgi:hypothetical protein
LERQREIGPWTAPAWRREKLSIRLVHLTVEIRSRKQNGDLHDKLDRAPSSFEDGADIVQALKRLLCIVLPTTSVGAPPGRTGI